MSTNSVLSFVDSNTLQLRIELGHIDQGRVTTEIPNDINFNVDDGYAFAQEDSTYVGRVRGSENQFYVPLDTYTPSDIEDLFDWSEINSVRTAPVDDVSGWSVLVNGQPVTVTGISRKANILETATTGWDRDFSTVQNVFLELQAPLPKDANIEVTFDDEDFDAITGQYDPETTVSEAIHVNLTGFDPDDGAKTAYLSSWNGFEHDPNHERGGQGVSQVYDVGLSFNVIDEATGSVVYTGQTTLAQGIDEGTNFWQNYASTDVYQMDFSSLTVAGTYHIAVDGVGRSNTFELADDHWEDVFGLSFSGYYHQRSGITLDSEYTDWERDYRALHPDDGITVHQTTVKITETSEAWDGALPKPFEFWDGNLTGETLEDAWGGWHDAGDFDRRTQHMETSRKLVELHEQQTEWSESFVGSIPEAKNGIPDILDEAIWGTAVFRRLQHDDGGIPGGIESETYGSFGDSSFTDQRDLYVYAPDAWSSWEYAATAAKISRALLEYDASEAAAWLDSGVRAFEWAEANTPTGEDYDNGYYPRSRNIAATELFEATGETAYADIFEETFVYGKGQSIEWFEHQYEAAFAYANSTQPTADEAIKADAIATLVERADWLLENGSNSGFGFISDPYAPYGWGNTATQPTNSSEILLRAHALTGDDSYLNAAQKDVDYAFGANPMNMSYVTGLDSLVPGVRQAEEILDADTDVLGLDPKPGITLYAEYNVYDYGWGFYHSDMWEDTWPNYYDAPVHESWNGNYSYVPVTEFTVMQGMEDMTFVTGYLAALANDGSQEPVNPEPGPARMEVGTVKVQQSAPDYWQRVEFGSSIEDAVVVMGPGSHHGANPFAVRVRDIDDTGFEFQIDEWSYQDGRHFELAISWLAGTAGHHTMDDGTQIAFGTAQDSGTASMTGFTSAPVVLGQLVGDDTDTPLTHRIKGISDDSFEFIVQSEEALSGRTYEEPQLNYVALLDQAEGGAIEVDMLDVDHNWTQLADPIDPDAHIFADMQSIAGSNPATLRYKDGANGSVSVIVQEETSLDKEIWHFAEEVAVVTFQDGEYVL